MWEYPPSIMFVPADLALLAFSGVILAKGTDVRFYEQHLPHTYIYIYSEKVRNINSPQETFESSYGNTHLYNVRSQLITLFCCKQMASGFVKYPNCIKIYFSVSYTATSCLRSPVVATSNIISPRPFHSATKNLSNQSLASLTMKGVIQCPTPGSAMNLNFSETLALL